MQSKPLEGIKVVDMSFYAAGPVIARILADWGADVIKVESLDGDVTRRIDANMHIPRGPETGPNFDILNVNKRAIAVNLKTDEGKEIMEKLLAKADVFNSNMRMKALTKMGLDYESIHARFPKIVWAHLSAYGLVGPDKDDPGFDTVAYWARTGKMIDFAEKDTSPLVPPIAVGDIMAGPVLAGGIAAALVQRLKTGKGDQVLTSLYGMGIWSNAIMGLAVQGPVTRYPKSRKQNSPLSNTYKCKDGEWIMVMALNWSRQFPQIMKLLGLEKYIDDPRYADTESADANSEELICAIEEKMLLHTVAEWDRIFKDNDIPHSVLRHMGDEFHDEQALVNGFVYPYQSVVGEYMLPAPPVQIGGHFPPEHRLAPPLLGGNTAEIMKEYGYSDAQIDDFKKKKIIIVR